MVSESRVTWATSVSISVFLGLSVLDLGDRQTDRQTDKQRDRQTDKQTDVDRRQTALSLNAPA